jgi:GNAT superfamily N-acetyltransferase
MSAEIVIRRAQPEENDLIQCMVQAIADETFVDLFPPGVPIREANWLTAWVAFSGEVMVGVSMTKDEWVSDLWVRRANRRSGVGARLLANAELEIANRGHTTSRLRVVKANTSAVQFYLIQGWRIGHEFLHEKYNHPMFEMLKSNGTISP